MTSPLASAQSRFSVCIKNKDTNTAEKIVGGGQGGFLAEVLKAFPTVTGMLYDRPQVVQEPAYLKAAGLITRCEVVGGDFFQSAPKGGDVYVLKRILHDWNDEQCVQILRVCREAMGDNARLLVVDAVVPPGNDPHPGKIMDMLMMVLLEGQERTEQEFAALYGRVLHLLMNEV